jgi:hypothetical protein
MKLHTILLSTLFLSTNAMADREFQISNIVGDWDFGKGGNVLRILKQTDETIKVYSCDRDTWLNSNTYCKYSNLLLYTYDSGLDGFCSQGGNFCETGLQVSQQFPNEILNVVDPTARYGFRNTGYVVEGRKN